MEGVLGMITADDIPAGPPGFAPSLTKEPMYVGEPILAVAALSASRPPRTPSRRSRSTTSRCRSPSIRWRACFPAARTRAATDSTSARWRGLPPGKIKWTAADFARVKRAMSCPWASPPRSGTSATSRRSSSSARWCTRSASSRRARASQHGAAQLHGLLAERQVLRARHPAEPVVRAAAAGADARHQARRSGAHRRILRWRLRLQGLGLSLHGRSRPICRRRSASR